MLAITGERDGPPVRSPFSPVDQATGLHALIGILALLHERERTGMGGVVEASLFDSATALPRLLPPGLLGARHRARAARLRPRIAVPLRGLRHRRQAADPRRGERRTLAALSAGSPSSAKSWTTRGSVPTPTASPIGRKPWRWCAARWRAAPATSGWPCSARPASRARRCTRWVSCPSIRTPAQAAWCYSVDAERYGSLRTVAQPLRFDGQRTALRTAAARPRRGRPGRAARGRLLRRADRRARYGGRDPPTPQQRLSPR